MVHVGGYRILKEEVKALGEEGDEDEAMEVVVVGDTAAEIISMKAINCNSNMAAISSNTEITNNISRVPATGEVDTKAMEVHSDKTTISNEAEEEALECRAVGTTATTEQLGGVISCLH